MGVSVRKFIVLVIVGLGFLCGGVEPLSAKSIVQSAIELGRDVKDEVRRRLLVFDLSTFYALPPLSIVNEQLVRATLRELKVKDADTIILRRYYNILAEASALVAPLRARFIIINEEWFNTLSHDEKKYIIGHEAMHIEYQHGLKKAIAVGAWLYLGSRIVARELSEGCGCGSNLIKHYNWSKILYVTGFFWISAPLLDRWISRMCEAQADKESAQRLKVVNAAVQLYRNRVDARRSFKQQSLLARTIEWLYSTHPSDKQRMIAMQKLQKSKEYSTPVS